MEQRIAISGRDRWWFYLAGFRHALACIFFLFMPFTQALTFNLGFPLKFSELALFLLTLMYVPLNRRTPLPRPVIVTLSLLFSVITLSMIINFRWNYPYALRGFITRFGYAGDSISRYVYFLLALMSFFVSVDLFLSRRETYIKWWIYGALAAGAYSWYLVLSGLLNVHVFLLPGMATPPQMILGHIIRCGTFPEGNMLGLYTLLSAAMCFYVRRIKSGIFLLLTTFTSFSTLSVICIFLFLVLYLYRQVFRRKNLVYLLPALIFMTAAIGLFVRTSFYRTNVERKIFGSSDRVQTAEGYSKVDRVFSIRTAWRMGVANPVWGVGLANYSRHFDHYTQRGALTPDEYKRFLHVNSRVIPNNIYVELWAECGGTGLLLFVFFLLVLLYYARREQTQALFPGLVCMVVCFIAYPSFIMIYLWSFMALPVAAYVDRYRRKPAISPNLIAPAL